LPSGSDPKNALRAVKKINLDLIITMQKPLRLRILWLFGKTQKPIQHLHGHVYVRAMFWQEEAGGGGGGGGGGIGICRTCAFLLPLSTNKAARMTITAGTTMISNLNCHTGVEVTTHH